MANAQSRKWTLVINNPDKCNLDHQAIKEKLDLSFPEYYCLCDEIGETGTYHTHIFIYSKSPIRFNTLKDRFPTAHIEKAYGSSYENRAYILKSGKWENSRKAETSVKGTFEEQGNIPSAQAEKQPTQFQLLQEINDGKRTAEIISDNPEFVFRVKEIETLRQTMMSEQYGDIFRELEVFYLYGASGTGKTKSIYANHLANDICRITNYKQKGNGVCFDAYSGQKVLVFEEFYSQIPIEEMLNYLDIYPLQLPARYSDKVACYTTVYITSNVSLYEQYADVQCRRPETWRAFLRRISKVIEFTSDGKIIERSK